MLPKCCKDFGIIITGSLCILSLFSLILIGAALKAYSSTSLRVANYKQTTCTLTAASVITVEGPPTNVYCLDTKYVAVWKSLDGSSILESPLSSSTSQSYTQSLLDNYQLNTPLECTCDDSLSNIMYPNFNKEIPCDFYAKCFMNVEIVNYIKSQNYFDMVGNALLVVGTISLFIVLLFTVISCIDHGYCRCKKREYIDLDVKVEVVEKHP